ncbi:MAG: DUF503 domain-containing protein [Christensenellales bacterium]|jgi:uncharacterized protein YlxP (DUF503 family)
MHVALVTVRLRADWCNSLKDKRSEVKTLVSGVRNRFNAACCESGALDEMRLIEISACFLAHDRAQGDAIAARIEGFIASRTDAEVLSAELEYR